MQVLRNKKFKKSSVSYTNADRDYDIANDDTFMNF